MHIISGLVATICMDILHETFYVFWLKHRERFALLCFICLFQALKRQKQKWKIMKRVFLPSPLDMLAFLEKEESQLGILLF